jgi:hypothetical protein
MQRSSEVEETELSERVCGAPANLIDSFSVRGNQLRNHGPHFESTLAKGFHTTTFEVGDLHDVCVALAGKVGRCAPARATVRTIYDTETTTSPKQ